MLKLLLKKELDMVSKKDIKWFNTSLIVFLHIISVVSLVVLPLIVKWETIIWGIFIGGVGGFGVTAGAHRLWTHRSYKAKLPLRIILINCYSVAGQNPLFQWVRDHRVHHKYTETEADPHNSKRGFFFAHVGWLMQQKHPEVIRRGNMINMSDIVADPVVNFHQKYFWPMKIWWCFTFPVLVPPLLWAESWIYSFFAMTFVRYCFGLNFTWLVNSAAHIWGNKPYDKNIDPVQNRFVALVSLGEGWHNYHHCFPWDYRAEELGGFIGYPLNISTFLIDIFALIGWAYDRKVPDSELVRKIAEKRGDGTYSQSKCKDKTNEGEDNVIGTALEIWDTERNVQSETLSTTDNLKKECSNDNNNLSSN